MIRLKYTITKISKYQRPSTLFLFIFLCYTLQSFPEELVNNCYKIPYEICNWQNEQYTEEMLEKTKKMIETAKQSYITEAFSSCTSAHCDDFRGIIMVDGYRWVKNTWKNFLSDCSLPNRSPIPNIPNICFYANMLRPVAGIEKFYHCENANNSPKEKMNFLCSKENKNNCAWFPSHKNNEQLCSTLSENECTKTSIDPVKFCQNKEYVQTTAAAFNKLARCFEFSKDDIKSVFALFSHESSFMLNAHSRDEDQARCYGAVTGNTFEQINRYIYAHDNIHRHIYSETFVESCCGPHKNSYKNFSECSNIKKQLKEQEGKEVEMKIIDDRVDSYCTQVKNWQRYADIFSDAKRKCPHLPEKVFPQKILKYEYKDKNGKLKNRTNEEVDGLSTESNKFTCALTHDPYTCMLYSMYYAKMNAKNFEVILSTFPHLFEIESRPPPLQRIPLFSKKVLRKFFIQTAHNFGSGFKSTFPQFLEHLKRKFSENDPQYKSYHDKLLNGNSLTEKDLFDTFKMFFNSEVKNKKKNKEARHFAEKVQKNMDYMDHKKNEKDLRRNFRTYVKDKDGNTPSDEEVENFVKAVKQQCTKPPL